MKHEVTLNALLETITRLRAEDGCPWDRAQTHESLVPFLEEESAEVIDAIHDADPANLKEELADLLLQILLHSEIASERNEFDFLDVCDLLREKIIRRHPHVFAGKKYASIAEQKEDWVRIKEQERQARGELTPISLLAKIPKAMPALKQANKLQEKAATVGFDWDNIEDVIAKVDEERAELFEAMAEKNQMEIQNELGDYFFSLVNLSRFLSVDPVEALNGTNQKFRNRFSFIEKNAPKLLNEMTLDELDQYWDLAKVAEKTEQSEQRRDVLEKETESIEMQNITRGQDAK